jgi:hypothetical protein
MLSPYKYVAEVDKSDGFVPSQNISRKFLLTCGLLSSIVYVLADVVCTLFYDGYNAASQTVSELSAIDTPTRSIWLDFMIIHSILIVLFAWGIRQFTNSRNLRRMSYTLFTYVLIGLFWPPMHQREALAAGGGSLTDTFHIVFTFINVPLMLLAIGFAAAAFGRAFRIYSIITIVLMLTFGMLTGLDSPAMEANLPTPFIGIWERICIGAYLLWMALLSIFLLAKKQGISGRPAH